MRAAALLSNCFHSLPLFRVTPARRGDLYRQALYLPDTTAMLLFCTQPSAELAKKVVWAGWRVGVGMWVESEGRGCVLSSPGSRGRIVGRQLRSRHFRHQSALVAVADGGVSIKSKGYDKDPDVCHRSVIGVIVPYLFRRKAFSEGVD